MKTQCECCGATTPATRDLETDSPIEDVTLLKHADLNNLACSPFCALQISLQYGPDPEADARWEPWQPEVEAVEVEEA